MGEKSSWFFMVQGERVARREEHQGKDAPLEKEKEVEPYMKKKEKKRCMFLKEKGRKGRICFRHNFGRVG